MNPVLRNVLGIIAGCVVGGIVNMALIYAGIAVIGLPEGADINSLADHIDSFEGKHFLTPLLAHAIGTLVGAFVAAKIVANNKMMFAITIGIFFLVGGIMSVRDIGGPVWFIVLDLVLAYIPMGWLGGKLATRGDQNNG